MLRVLLLTSVVLCLWAQPSHAGTVTFAFDGTISAGRMGPNGPGKLDVYLVDVVAEAGETNQIVFSADDSAVIVRDGGAPLEARSGCQQEDPNAVRCPLADAFNSRVRAHVDAGDGNDRVSAGWARFDERGVFESVMNGGSGDDVLEGNNGSDLFDGGAGADAITGGGGLNEVTYAARTAPVAVSLDGAGGDGEAGENDNVAADVKSITGGNGADVLDGAASVGGKLVGNGGDDVLRAGKGYSRLFGGTGDDHLVASPDDDRLVGDSGADSLEGGDGNDELDGGPGADVLDGGPGAQDQVTYMQAPAAVTVDIDGVADDGALGEGDNVTLAVEEIDGTNYDDTLTGSEGPDHIDGQHGRDEIHGLGGDDRLIGGDLGGTIDAGPGADSVLAWMTDAEAFGSYTRVYARDGEADTITCFGPFKLDADLVDDRRECLADGAIDLTTRTAEVGRRGRGRIAAILHSYHRRATGRFAIVPTPNSRKTLATGRFNLIFRVKKRLRYRLSQRGQRYLKVRERAFPDGIFVWVRFRGRGDTGLRVSATEQLTLSRRSRP